MKKTKVFMNDVSDEDWSYFSCIQMHINDGVYYEIEHEKTRDLGLNQIVFSSSSVR